MASAEKPIGNGNNSSLSYTSIAGMWAISASKIIGRLSNSFVNLFPFSSLVNTDIMYWSCFPLTCHLTPLVVSTLLTFSTSNETLVLRGKQYPSNVGIPNYCLSCYLKVQFITNSVAAILVRYGRLTNCGAVIADNIHTSM